MTTTAVGHPPGLRHLVLPAALTLIVLQLCHRAWALVTGYFYTDDYVLLMTARAQGPGLQHLLEPYNGHLMPGTRLIAWLVEASGPLNWGLALTFSLLLQAVASLACLWMLLTLVGRRWLVVAALALYVTTATTAQASLWWISSLNQISIQATFFLAVGAWVSYLRTRDARWLAATALAVAGGLLFFQKSLLVLPVLVFVALVYFASGGPVQRLVLLLRRYWPAVVVMGAVAGAYAAYSLAEVEQPFTGGNRLDLLRLAGYMGGAAAVAALGGPWRWQWHEGGAWADPPAALLAASVVVLAALAALSVLRRRRAGWAWALLAGYLGLLVLLVATSRTPVFGAGIGLAYRFQTDLVCVLVLSLALALAPVRGALQSSEPRTRVPGPVRLARLVSRPVPAPWLAGGVAVVALSGLVCWTTYAVIWHERNDSRAYLRALDRDLASHGATALADDPVPDAVLPRAFFDEDQVRVSGLVGLLGHPADYPRSSPDLAVVAGDGRLHRALVDPSTVAAPGPNPNCGWLGLPPRVRVPLTARTLDLDWWVRIGYLSTSTDDVVVTLGDDRVPARVFDGLGNLYVRASGEFDALVVSGLSPDTRLCVDAVEVGTLTEGPVL